MVAGWGNKTDQGAAPTMVTYGVDNTLGLVVIAHVVGVGVPGRVYIRLCPLGDLGSNAIPSYLAIPSYTWLTLRVWVLANYMHGCVRIIFSGPIPFACAK